MLLLLLVISSLSRGSPHASPLLAGFVRLDVVSLDSSVPTAASCSCPDQRSVWDIVWSCFATIFACSWIAVHPDVPAPDETWWRITMRRAEYMFWTILTPELIIYWAARQWFGAFANTQFGIAKEHGWTMTHGHFVQMGGFSLVNRGESKGVLSMDRLNDLAVQGRIEFPQISEKEIEDRSKSDSLTKILVVGQTTWFILQVLARRIQGLVTTELEIATLAFAALNAAMYFFWWNKPCDVQISLPVTVLPMEESDGDSEMGTHPILVIFSVKFMVALYLSYRYPSPMTAIIMLSTSGVTGDESTQQDLVHSQIRRFGMTLLNIYTWPLSVVAFLARRLHAMTENYEESNGFDNVTGTTAIGPDQVPRFYASITIPRDERKISAFVALIGVVFGAVHCAAWFFTFPSVVERQMWRVGSLVTVGIPFIFLAMMIPTDGILKPHNTHFTKGVKGFVRTRIVSQMFKILLPTYGLARLALVVGALISLRNLPSGAYDSVEWTTFIPHI